jgi:CPA1 family monovalent cation:H+ antiporter
MIARRFDVPYTLALVLAGLALGLLQLRTFAGVHLTPHLLLTLLLPPLLFEASFHLDWRRFRRDAPITLALAGPGVLVSTAVTAAATWGAFRALGLQGLDAGAACLFAAIVAATDPVSVLALFKALEVDRRLYLLVEGESLLNDGVAVVMFLIVAGVLGVSVGYDTPEIGSAGDAVLYGVRTLLWMGGGGVVVGALVGLASSAVTRVIDDHLLEVTLTVIVAWGSFVAAESVHASGVLACVAAGVVHGNVGARFGMSPATRVAVIEFWEFLAFFGNTLVFLLIGLELEVRGLVAVAVPIGLGWFAVQIGRIAVVGFGYGAARALSGVEPLPSRWAPVLVWGGLRGSLSMVLVIGLPPDYPARGLLLPLVFGVTGLTLLVQGLTMRRVLGAAGLLGAVRDPATEEVRTRRVIAARALAEIDRLVLEGRLGEAAADRLRSPYRREVAPSPEVDAADVREAERQLIAVERDALHEAVHDGLASASVVARLQGELAARREAQGRED